MREAQVWSWDFYHCKQKIKTSFLTSTCQWNPAVMRYPSSSMLKWFFRKHSKVQELSSLISNTNSTLTKADCVRIAKRHLHSLFTFSLNYLQQTEWHLERRSKSSLPFSSGKYLCKLVKALEFPLSARTIRNVCSVNVKGR